MFISLIPKKKSISLFLCLNNVLAKPVIIVSKCLGFAHCRYNGLIITSEFVEQLKPFVEFHPVCPELEIGLGVPREPVRVVDSKGQMHLVQPATGIDCTAKMQNFIERFLLAEKEIDGFLLKSRSPSCGIKDVKIFAGIENNYTTRKAAGFFGNAVLTKYPQMPVEDEGRLINFKIREHFLTRIFTAVRFNKIRNLAKSM